MRESMKEQAGRGVGFVTGVFRGKFDFFFVHGWPVDAPRWPKERPRWPHDATYRAQTCPKTAQKIPQETLGRFQDGPKWPHTSA